MDGSAPATTLRAALCVASIVGAYKQRRAGESLASAIEQHGKTMLIRGVSGAVVIAILKKLEGLIGQVIAPVPGALGGMILLSAALIIAEESGQRQARKAARNVVAFSEPASQFLSKWMPLFFAPPLVTLPLAVKNVSARDAPVALALHIALFFGTTATTAIVAKAVSRLMSTLKGDDRSYAPVKPPAAAGDENDSASTSPTNKASATSEPQLQGNTSLFVTLCATALLSALALVTRSPQMDRGLLVCVTALTYVLGTSSNTVKNVLHPVLVCAGLTAVCTRVLGGDKTALASYAAGPGAVYMNFLGASLFALGFRMYKSRKLIFSNTVPIVAGSAWAAVFSLYGTASLGRLLRLDSTVTRALTVRSLTTPLAIAIANILRADVSLGVGAVMLSGLLGANFGKKFLRQIRVDRRDSMTRGVSLGASAHGLGTAALAADEPDASSTAAVTFALTGTLSTLIASSVPLRRALQRITDGSIAA